MKYALFFCCMCNFQMLAPPAGKVSIFTFYFCGFTSHIDSLSCRDIAQLSLFCISFWA